MIFGMYSGVCTFPILNNVILLIHWDQNSWHSHALGVIQIKACSRVYSFSSSYLLCWKYFILLIIRLEIEMTTTLVLLFPCLCLRRCPEFNDDLFHFTSLFLTFHNQVEKIYKLYTMVNTRLWQFQVQNTTPYQI